MLLVLSAGGAVAVAGGAAVLPSFAWYYTYFFCQNLRLMVLLVHFSDEPLHRDLYRARGRIGCNTLDIAAAVLNERWRQLHLMVIGSMVLACTFCNTCGSKRRRINGSGDVGERKKTYDHTLCIV